MHNSDPHKKAKRAAKPKRSAAPEESASKTQKKKSKAEPKPKYESEWLEQFATTPEVAALVKSKQMIINQIMLGRSNGAVFSDVADNSENHDKAKNAYKSPSGGKKAEWTLGTDYAREPRSYDSQRIKQMMRWTSTCINHLCPNGIEVECYYDENYEDIFISSNLGSVNEDIAEWIENNEGSVVQALMGEFDNLVKAGGRVERHAIKFAYRFDAHEDEQDAPFSILNGEHGNIVVTPDDKKLPKGLHAERRILVERNKALAKYGIKKEDINKHVMSPDNLGGLRRPCAHCTEAIGFLENEDVHAGPMWLSDAAIGGTDPIKFAKAFAKHWKTCTNPGSNITTNAMGRQTLDEDSDSDSEAEDLEEARKKVAAYQENTRSSAAKKSKGATSEKKKGKKH